MLFLSMLTIVAVSACGGGGGGGGGGGSDDDSSSASGVRVLHAAIDGSPMDVISSAGASTVVNGSVFAGTKGYKELPGGAQTISLTRTATPSRVIGSFDVTGGGSYSILLYGSNQTTGLKAALLTDVVPDFASGAGVRVVNGALGASQLNVSVGGVSASVAFGEANEYLNIPSGATTMIARGSGAGAVSSYSFTAEAGRAYTLLVAGEVGYYVTTRAFTDR
jgi:hypothetical protein